MTIEIVDLPSYKMVILYSYVNVYQRVSSMNLHESTIEWDLDHETMGFSIANHSIFLASNIVNLLVVYG